MTVHSRRMVSALLFFFSSFYLSSQEITPRYCAIPDNLVQDRIYSVKNNCTLRLTFRSEITEDQIEIKISPNDKWDEESGVPIRFVFEQETGDPNGKKIIELQTRNVPDKHFILVKQEERVVKIQVRNAFFWDKLSFGAALAFTKKTSYDSEGNEQKEWHLIPSPIVYTALAWSYNKTLLNYILPRSAGILINPSFVNIEASGNLDDNLLPLLTIGGGMCFIDNHLLLGIAYDFGETAWRYIIAYNF